MSYWPTPSAAGSAPSCREELAAAGSVQDRPPRLYSVEEAADLIGVARSTCYGLLADGRLRSILVGRRRLIPADAITEMVAKQ